MEEKVLRQKELEEDGFENSIRPLKWTAFPTYCILTWSAFLKRYSSQVLSFNKDTISSYVNVWVVVALSIIFFISLLSHKFEIFVIMLTILLTYLKERQYAIFARYD